MGKTSKPCLSEKNYMRRSDKACYNYGNKPVSNDFEVFSSKITALAAEYVERFQADNLQNVKDWFPALIVYVSDALPKPDVNNCRLLQSIFGEYVKVCSIYGYIPTVSSYCELVGIASNTLYGWTTTERTKCPEYSTFAKLVIEKCKGRLVDKMTQGGASVNQIFIAKALYGMTETAPVQTINHIHTVAIDDLKHLNLSARHEQTPLLDVPEVIEEDTE